MTAELEQAFWAEAEARLPIGALWASAAVAVRYAVSASGSYVPGMYSFPENESYWEAGSDGYDPEWD